MNDTGRRTVAANLPRMYLSISHFVSQCVIPVFRF